MKLPQEVCIQAMRSKDTKFDGRFFVGVHSTGIYCRPICPAPSPKLSNIEFFPSAAAAAGAGLRPCLRCRPETAPGTMAWDGASVFIKQALHFIAEAFPNGLNLTEVAEKLGVSQRHLRRLFRQHLGTTPFAVWQNQKLQFAKRLIDETQLSMADIAFASGYGSIRSFNDTFKKVYRLSPATLRKSDQPQLTNQPVVLYLPFQAPLNWNALLDFMKVRAIPGVETVIDDVYYRVIRFRKESGLIKVWLEHNKRAGNRLSLQIDFPPTELLFRVSEKVKRLFDLDAPILEIDDFLWHDPLLRDSIAANRGIRIPGYWDPFELSIRAILGQQISVKGATTIAGRIVAALGEKVLKHGDPSLPDYVFPGPEVLKAADLTGLGLTSGRIETIRSFSAAVEEGLIQFGRLISPELFREQLKTIKGIGEWTAQYISMRVLRDPDAFPESDLGLLKAVSPTRQKTKPKDLLKLSQKWRPWRAYAGMYLWRK